MKKLLALSLFFILLINCEDRTDLTEPAPPDTGDADFSRYISIGNSLTAGYQNGALYESAQIYSYGKLISGQAGAQFVQPTIDDPGLGGRIETVSVEPLSFSYQELVGGLPNNNDYDSVFNNLGVPGAILSDLINASDASTSSQTFNLFFDIVLRGRGTVLEQVKSFNPTLITLWIGNNDILGYATSGGLQNYTSPDSFAIQFDRLCEELSKEQAPVFIANIPDVTTIPYFTTISPLIGERIMEIEDEDSISYNLFYEHSDNSIKEATVDDLNNNDILVTLRGADALEYIGTRDGSYYQSSGISVPSYVDITSPFGLSVKNPLPNRLLLDPAEQSITENIVSSFNSSILGISLKYDFNLVDINTVFNNVAANGITVEGVEFTTEFISGGLFSLDGIHPSSQGYAIIANEFLNEINDRLSAEIPLVNVSTIPGSLEIAKLGKIKSTKLKLPIFEKNTFEYPFY
ncbi:MAG: SGNH/GDSL hydrolase family protein [Melioribacteraceae bacterium]|nr:SGNH/GDSL hydrolase family protein [Melioribacteraceae bacterium]